MGELPPTRPGDAGALSTRHTEEMERSDNRLHTERSLGLLLAAALGAGVALALAAAAAGAGVGMALLAFASTAAFGLASDGRSEAALRRFRGPR